MFVRFKAVLIEDTLKNKFAAAVNRFLRKV